ERAEPIDDQRAKREIDAFLQIFGFCECTEAQVGGELLCSGYHRCCLPTLAHATLAHGMRRRHSEAPTMMPRWGVAPPATTPAASVHRHAPASRTSQPSALPPAGFPAFDFFAADFLLFATSAAS